MACLPYMEAIYLTQQQRMFIQRQGENRREHKVSIDASMALIAVASSATAFGFSVFSCKVGRIQVHCQAKNNLFKLLFFMKISAQKFSGGEWVANPRRWNVATSMVGLKSSHICKNLTKDGEPQRSSWGTQKKKKKSGQSDWKGDELKIGSHNSSVMLHCSLPVTLCAFGVFQIL